MAPAGVDLPPRPRDRTIGPDVAPRRASGSAPLSQTYTTFRDFYPYYLSEHADRTCRRLHFVGSALVIVLIGVVLAGVLSPWWLLVIPVIGYGFAWVGHFAFEKNKPATFKYPFYSLAGDWVMFGEMLTGKIRF